MAGYGRDKRGKSFEPMEFDEIHFGKGIMDYLDISEVYYGLQLVWEYISSNLISRDNQFLQTKDGYILNSRDKD